MRRLTERVGWIVACATIALMGTVACGDEAVDNDANSGWNIGNNDTPNGDNDPEQNQNANQQNYRPGVVVDSVEVTPSTLSLGVQESRELVAVAIDDKGDAVDDVTMSWESDDDSVATVDSEGVVTGVAEGGAVITVTVTDDLAVDEVSASAAVTVHQKAWHHVVAGAGTSCGSTWDGDMYCWGSNFHGALGQPGQTAALNSEPIEVALAASVEGMTAGFVHYCAWDANGQTYCWGRNQFGQTGAPPSETVVVPTAIGGSTFTKVEVSGQYSCGLNDDGEILCWGSNVSGELGLTDVSIATTPTLVPTGETMIDVSTGPGHACGIDESGSVHCWGRNFVGAVDPGVITDEQLPPTEVSALSDPATRVVTGATTTCALIEGGEIWCWGYNAQGEIGRDVSVEAIIGPGAVDSDATFVDVSMTGHSVCALTDDAEVYCWGENRYGAVGDGSFENRSTPVAVQGNQQWESVSAGTSHSCGIDTEGETWCWGSNGFGEIGDRRSLNRFDPEPVVGDGLRFDRLITGNFNVCGVEHGGDEVYCWGRNDHSQHQQASPGHSSAPAPIGQWSPDVMALGDAFGCGIDLDGGQAGPLRCWGSNGQGRLGIGQHPHATADPTDIDSDEEFIALDAGNVHACAVSDGHETYCWGGNGAGQVGADADSPQFSPRRVEEDVDYVAVATGLDHSCGLTDDGDIRCWGGNGAGQLGHGHTSDNESVADVVFDYDFVALAAGNNFTCGLADEGDIVCWGVAAYFTGVPGATFDDAPLVFQGEWETLKVGPSVVCAISDEELHCAGWDQDGWIAGQAFSPVQELTHVDHGHAVVDVAVGSSYMCTADGDGVVRCLGHDAWGVLGDGSPVLHPEPVHVDAP